MHTPDLMCSYCTRTLASFRGLWFAKGNAQVICSFGHARFCKAATHLFPFVSAVCCVFYFIWFHLNIQWQQSCGTRKSTHATLGVLKTSVHLRSFIFEFVVRIFRLNGDTLRRSNYFIFNFFSYYCRGRLLKKRLCSPKCTFFSLCKLIPLGTASSSRKANRTSRKLLPFENTEENTC